MREIKEQYSLETIIPLIGGPKVNLDGDEVKVSSLRMVNFRKHGITCVKCGLKGIYFLKERSSKDVSFHLNLYAEKDGKKVLMTRDHIIPTSGGGPDTLENSQTMCVDCNVKKGGRMSTFVVQLRKLSKIYPHTNADKLELGQVGGLTFQFCVQKGLYQVGENVVFFPVDSVLPQELIAQQGITSFMKGKSKNRVKTVTLRGEISQGYVASVSSIKQYLKVDTLPEDLTAALGVVKYEPLEISVKSGNLVGLPEQVYYYDIEGCDFHPEIVEQLMDQKVWISEKLEGSNLAAARDIEKKNYVCLHNHAINNLPDQEEHTFWQIARNEGFIDALEVLQNNYFLGCDITIRAEAIGPGIQGNYYQLKKHVAKIFDIEVNRKAIEFEELKVLLDKLSLREKFVPIIAHNVTLREWLNGQTVQQASHDKSVLTDRIREGIVIKPMKEQYIIGFGRLFIKQRDPIYLDKTDN